MVPLNHLALELLGSSLELCLKLLEVGRLLGHEEQVVRLNLAAEDDRSSLLAELADKGQTVRLDPSLDGSSLLFLLVVDTAVIEGLEEHDSVLKQECQFRGCS